MGAGSYYGVRREGMISEPPRGMTKSNTTPQVEEGRRRKAGRIHIYNLVYSSLVMKTRDEVKLLLCKLRVAAASIRNELKLRIQVINWLNLLKSLASNRRSYAKSMIPYS